MAARSQPIVSLTRGTVICEHAVVADRVLPRMRGLLGRRSLPDGEGILLQPAPSIHTAFMRFSIDVIFLDRDLHVVKLVETLRPWRMASTRRAHAALELATGQAAARGIQVGDQLALATAPVPGADETPPTKQRDDELLMPAGGAANSLHVLLVGKDRRFRSVTSALLARRGCAVTLGERIDADTMRGRRGSVDVVVIDTASSPVAAAREALHLQTLDPPLGIVLLSHAPSAAAPTVPVLAKWGPFDELYGAIRRVSSERSRRHANGGL
jgi:uncharacterized protein